VKIALPYAGEQAGFGRWAVVGRFPIWQLLEKKLRLRARNPRMGPVWPDVARMRRLFAFSNVPVEREEASLLAFLLFLPRAADLSSS